METGSWKPDTGYSPALTVELLYDLGQLFCELVPSSVTRMG